MHSHLSTKVGQKATKMVHKWGPICHNSVVEKVFFRRPEKTLVLEASWGAFGDPLGALWAIWAIWAIWAPLAPMGAVKSHKKNMYLI